MMRRATGSFATLGLVLLALPGVASALPRVSFKADAVPVPGFLHTGNILGAGAAIHTEYKIEGTEYGGSPPPLVGLDLYLPKGTKLHTSGFPACAKGVLEQTGPEGCKASSRAGPTGNALATVSVGGERLEESTTIESFYSPEGGLEFFTAGNAPSLLAILASGSYEHLAGAGGYGPELVTQVPLVSALAGAEPVSFETLELQLGSAYRSSRATVYYLRMPLRCPRGGFPVKTEAIFDENAAQPIVPETVVADYDSPCPHPKVAPPETATAPEAPAPPEAESPAPTTAVPGTEGIITAPSSKQCLSRRDFSIHVQQIKGLTYRRVSVYVNGHRVNVTRKARFGATVDLRGLPKGRYTVKIIVLTAAGRRISGTRAYHTCAPKPLPFKPPKL